MIKIEELKAGIPDKTILNGINLKINKGEVHAIMGPNGSGKSTLSKVIAGHPAFGITGGKIEFEVNGKMQDLSSLAPFERAREGIFLSFQYPIEIPGVTNFTFLFESFNEICAHQGAEKMNESDFRKFLEPKLKKLDMKENFLDRSLNEGFSGGEKKKNEILQMLVLNPRLAFLDETDSGLDIDALKVVAEGVNSFKSKNNAVVLVTHYQRLLDYIKPDFVHVLANGKIIKSGDQKLALELESRGYDWLLN